MTPVSGISPILHLSQITVAGDLILHIHLAGIEYLVPTKYVLLCAFDWSFWNDFICIFTFVLQKEKSAGVAHQTPRDQSSHAE